MKLIIASDIHGSAYYCEEFLKRVNTEKADKILLLGDILYHGPRNDLPKDYRPKKVAEMLNEYKDEILCVRGNCDSEVDGMMLSFPILAEYALISIDKVTMFATHGHKYNIQNVPPLAKGEILLNGHTHIPRVIKREKFTYINPGSVSIPKENSHRGYVVFENGIFTFKDLDANVIKQFSVDE